MIALLRYLVLASALLLGQPLLAHGDKHRSEPAAPATPALVATSAPATAGAPELPVPEASPRPASQHDSESGSILTKLHPATVHFPIGLLIAAALTELLAMARSSAPLSEAARVMVWGGAIGAVVAALFGWIHTGLWLGGDGTMQLHRWTGTALALAAPIAALLSGRADRRAFRALLFLIAIALVAQGFWGGELAHGPNHLG